jgi:hypothetical protein
MDINHVIEDVRRIQNDLRRSFNRIRREGRHFQELDNYPVLYTMDYIMQLLNAITRLMIAIQRLQVRVQRFRARHSPANRYTRSLAFLLRQDTDSTSSDDDDDNNDHIVPLDAQDLDSTGSFSPIGHFTDSNQENSSEEPEIEQ